MYRDMLFARLLGIGCTVSHDGMLAAVQTICLACVVHGYKTTIAQISNVVLVCDLFTSSVVTKVYYHTASV